MDRSKIKNEILCRIIFSSFENPALFPKQVDEEVTRNRSLSSQDRREVTSLLHDAIRWRRRLWGDIPPSRLDQIRLQERIQEAKTLRTKPPLSVWSHETEDVLAQQLSYPTWLVERWLQSFGFESTVSLALALNEAAPTCFRVNVLKTSREALLQEFAKEKIPVEIGTHSPWALRFEGRKNLRSLAAFRKGWFEVQDEGSQLAALSSGAAPGQLVVDACTGAGGKALALAGMMKNKGRIIAADSDARPLDLLRERAKRAGAKIIEPVWVAADDPTPLRVLEEKAEVVLVDAPCSGLGTLRRKPWIRWSTHLSQIEGYPELQRKLLIRYSRWVKPGGTLLYVTCTLNELENGMVARQFLSEKEDFELANPFRTLRPDVEGCDGFFIGMFRKKINEGK